MRRPLVPVLAAAMLVGSGAAAADAKPGQKSPRLHAFRSCTNLLGYAQRNGLRVIRPTPLLRPPPAPMPQTGGGDGGTFARTTGPPERVVVEATYVPASFRAGVLT